MNEVKFQTKVHEQVSTFPSYSPIYNVIKRGFDISIALLAISFLFGLVLVISMLIMLDSPGNPFYIQERLGRNGKAFKLIKLRSMRKDAEQNGAQWATKNDSRITRVGAFIRRTRIDEIPQFINIIKGDMSIIGPRPERAFFYDKFGQHISNFKDRLVVKPGLTGWAQVNGGYELDPENKLEMDLFYIYNASFRLDTLIIWKTIRIIITGEGAR